MDALRKDTIMGVGVTNATSADILKYIVQSIKKNTEKYYIVSPNPEIIVFSQHDKIFKDILNQARISVCDGAGLLWASVFMGKPIKQRTTGTDLVKSLCEMASKEHISVGFLGGRHRVAEEAAKRLAKRYPKLQVGFVGEEFNESSKEKMKAVDILFVAFGFPKQEFWMSKNVGKVPAKVMMGVGGAFDYISGKIDRAPFVIRFLGFEWLYRLIREPWRFKRQLALIEFVKLVVKEMFKR